MTAEDPIESIIIGEVPFIIADGIARLTMEASFRAVGFSREQVNLTEA